MCLGLSAPTSGASTLNSLAACVPGRDMRNIGDDDICAGAEHRRDHDGIAARAINRKDRAASLVFAFAVGRTVRRRLHAVLLHDRAGWHTTGDFVVPRNLGQVFLPSRSPELNPVENVWPYLRANWLSTCVFDICEAIIGMANDSSCRLHHLSRPSAGSVAGLSATPVAPSRSAARTSQPISRAASR